jgi:hypothetical protein
MPPYDNGPAPLPWESYEAGVCADLKRMLDSGSGEKEMQRFLECHPPLVPGAFPEFSGHGAWPFALITQPDLKGFGHRIPDFMWITRHSGAVQPVLIEIEDPRKPWLADRKNPRPSYELTQALNQFRQWSEWLHANEDVFFRSFGVPSDWRSRRFRPRYVLIYGRKSEDPVEVPRLRQYLGEQMKDTLLLTFDHLAPIRDHENYLCVEGDGLGSYRAIAAPATARFTPNHPESWRVVSGRLDVVEAIPDITDERKAFLADHLPRCDAWAADYESIQREVVAKARRALDARS